jgi:DNA gyrase/topoisomerase IV subunit B
MSDLSLPTINYAELAEKLYKYKPISEPIIELYRLQQELEKRKAMSNLKAEVKEKFNAKLLKATNKSKYLMVAEGDSAIGSLPEVFGRNEISYLPLGGKLINSLKSRPEIIKKNKRAEDLIEAFGIGLPENRSENIIIATDSDLDGAHIRTLILALFYVLEPDVLINNRMFVLNTPVMVITDKKDNVFLLPISTQFESSGSVTATGRNIQWRTQVVEPLYESKTDHFVMFELAKRLGFYDEYTKSLGDGKGNFNWPDDATTEIAKGV